MAVSSKLLAVGAACLGGAFAFTSVPAQAWEPTKPVEFIVPAGTGGGADQMARLIQGIIAKHNLMKQPMVVINKSGGAGAEGFLDVKDAKGDPHKIIITLSNLFTTPLATGIPFNWKDLTPVAMMALDEFVLWVNADTPYKTAKEYIDAVKKAGPTTRSRWAAPARSRKTRSSRSRSRRRPARSSPTSRSRAAATWPCNWSASTSIRRSTIRSRRWRTGAPASCGRCACSTPSACRTRTRSPTTCRGTTSRPARRQGVDVDYLMLRGIFMPPRRHARTQVDLLRRPVQEGARNAGVEEASWRRARSTRRFMTGAEYAKWVERGREAARRPDEGGRLPRPRRTDALRQRLDRRPRAGSSIERRRQHEIRCGRGPSHRTRRRSASPAVDRAARRCIGHRTAASGSASAGRDDGPRAGYFPFYIGLLVLHLAARVNLVQRRFADARTTAKLFARVEPAARRCCGAGADARSTSRSIPLYRHLRRVRAAASRGSCDGSGSTAG